MKQKVWDRHAIKAEIYRRGKTLTALAEGAGLELSACRVALNRHHSAGEAAIAAFLGVPRSVLWPERPDSGSQPNPSAMQLGRTSPKARAA